MTNEMHSANHLVVFRTTKQWEFDVAKDALSQNQIPFYSQTENFAGMPTSIAAAPSQAPGSYWFILVPQNAWDRAREVLVEHRLDVAQHSVDEELSAEPETDKASKYFATFALLMMLSYLIVWAIMTFR